MNSELARETHFRADELRSLRSSRFQVKVRVSFVLPSRHARESTPKSCADGESRALENPTHPIARRFEGQLLLPRLRYP